MTCLLARGRGKPVTHIRSTNNKPQPYDQLRSLCVCVCVCVSRFKISCSIYSIWSIDQKNIRG